MKRVIYILVAILICFGIGYTANLFQSEPLETWYPMLIKSELTPPNYVFPVAWSIIYVCSGISIGLVWNKRETLDSGLAWIFILQLVFNFAWSLLFFYLQDPFSGLIDLILLDLTVLFYVITCYRINKVSAWLFAPYILWLILATYLNTFIVINNPIM